MDSLLKSYLKRHFNSIPSHCISADSNRITLFYFLICSSELNHQIIKDFDLTSYLIKTGFTGHLFINKSHITMTFSALNCLLTLGDDLSRIDRKSIVSSLKVLQLHDGRLVIDQFLQISSNNCLFLVLQRLLMDLKVI